MESASDGPIGEVWFQRAEPAATDPALLLKLLFANESLSIQVHPDDSYARSMGLPNGKTEAWYILAAEPDAKVALGLNTSVTAETLRQAITSGAIAELIAWHTVRAGDVIFVPAGTIHAIGAGLVIAEIQQNSDTTFRLFDYGRPRELHVEQGVAVANPGPAVTQAMPRRLTDNRTVLIECPSFVLERVDLPASTQWDLMVDRETWLLATQGDAQVGSIQLGIGQAVFMDADRAVIDVGPGGFSGLVAYTDAPPRQNPLRMIARTT